MTKKIINLFLLIFISFSVYAESTFHLIVIYDSQDEKIWAVKDKDNLVKNCTKYANLSGLKLNKIVHEQHLVTKATIESTIRRLNVGSDDVLWFAYSGHGQNVNGSEFPKMGLGTSATMTQDELHKLLKAKGARLTMSTFDCCNFTRKRIVDNDIASVGDRNPLGYIRLFKKGKANIKATGIKKGYLSNGYAIGTKEFGGLFTYSFIESIDLICNSAQDLNKISWKKVISKSKSKTNKLANNLSRTQIPYIELTSESYAPTPFQQAPCMEVEEGDTKQTFVDLIIDSYKLKGKDIIITTEDLKTCGGKLISSRKLIVGEKIEMEGYD
jgi:hypothetical protein